MTSQARNLSKYAFAQKSKLTTLLHQLVRSYPTGVGIIHEFIQNADDAGATTVSIVLDEREHPTGRLPSASMSQLQGPALVVVNDASFSDDDWERIQSTGRSGKALDASKTGRFGLGFNSVYNVTDWPGILTRDRVGFFDPHGETIDGASRDEPGAAWKLTPELWEECPDLLAPFHEYGLTTGARTIDHTVFRLPLRTQDVAHKSEICDQSFTRDDFNSLVRRLMTEAGELLLFLKSLTTISVRTISRDGRSRELATIRTSNIDEVTEGRHRVHGRLQAGFRDVLDFLRTADSDEVLSEFEHHVIIERPGVEPVKQTWAVAQALIAGPENELISASEEMFNYEEKAVPLVGAAALVHATSGQTIDRGRLFCTLPLSSVPSFLPLHINGFFDLQSDRQGIFADEGAEGKAAVRVAWNRALIQYGCSVIAATLLARIADGVVEAQSLYQYWPSVPDEVRTLLQALPGHTYEQLFDYECMPCGNDRRLAVPKDVLLLPSRERTVRQALLADDLPLANPVPPKHVVRGFETIDASLTMLTPRAVRDELRVEVDPACTPSDAPRQSIRSTDWLLELLLFCCSDSDLADLAGVPLALTRDGTLHAFGLGADPLLITTQEEQELLAALPQLLLDHKVIATPGFAEADHAGIERVTPDRLVSLLPQFLATLDDNERISWNPDEEGVPSEPWLTLFYKYMADHAEDCDLGADVLRKTPLVPDQFDSLWAMGHDSTPLLPSANRAQSRLVDALRPFRVPVVDASRDLLKEIRRLVEACGDQGIWRITGRDLIDTLSSVNDEWESATETYSMDTHGVLLSFLATPEARKGVAERASKLQSLPIFPASDRTLVTLDGDNVFLPAGYELPNIESGLGFLDVGPNGQWLPLYETLKVPSLSRARFIRNVLLPRYGELTSDDQIELLQWLRTHLEEAFNELDEDDGRTLLSELRSAELVHCTDGQRHQGHSLYHPDAEEPFGSLLGASAGFPDMAVYSIRRDSWFRLFERLGMATQPRAIDLLAAIDEAVELHTSDSARATSALLKIVGYVQAHWSDLRDVSVTNDPIRRTDATEWTVLEALSERAWLPVQHQAPRGFPRELFSDKGPLLSRPDGLYARDQLDLVSLVSPLSQFDLGVLGNDIGVRPSTDAAVTLHQLRAALGVVHARVNERTVRKRTVSLLRSVYRRLGELFPPLAEQDDEALAELRAIREEFAGLECVVDADDALWTPTQVFASPVPFFVSRRAQVRSHDDRIDRGLEVLGRRSKPSADDFVQFFDEMSAEYDGRPVEAEIRPQLRDAYRHAAQTDDVDGALREACVITHDGHLEPSGDVVIDDAEWLSDRAMEAGILVLDRQLDMHVAHAFGVTALSKAVFERPGRMTANHDETFASDCSAVEQVVRSEEFRSGLRRLIASTGIHVRDGDLEWLSDLALRPVEELYSELVWTDGQEVVEKSEGASDVLFDPDTGKIVASVQAADVLYERVASVIAHELAADGYILSDLSPLAAILRSDPDRISNLLTRLRVPTMIDEAEIVESEHQDDGGFIDDDSADEEAEGEVEGQAEAATQDDAGYDTDDDKTQPGTPDGKATVGHGRQQGGSGVGVEDRGEDREDSGGADDRRGRSDVGKLEPLAEDDGRRPSHAGGDTQRAPFHGSGVGRPRPGRSRGSHSTGRSRRAVTYVRGDSDSTQEQSEEMTEHRTEVDRAAIEIVLQYERREGRDPHAMDHYHPGYDIESKDAEGAIVRFVEVKGLSGAWTDFGVGVKPRQIEQCRQEPDRFWLYVVEFALEAERAQVFAIPDPVSLIDEYRFDGGWKALSREQSGGDQPEQPSVGRRVRLSDSREGTIESVDSRGALMRLTVRLDDGSEERCVYAPSRIHVLPDNGGG